MPFITRDSYAALIGGGVRACASSLVWGALVTVRAVSAAGGGAVTPAAVAFGAGDAAAARQASGLRAQSCKIDPATDTLSTLIAVSVGLSGPSVPGRIVAPWRTPV